MTALWIALGVLALVMVAVWLWERRRIEGQMVFMRTQFLEWMGLQHEGVKITKNAVAHIDTLRGIVENIYSRSIRLDRRYRALNASRRKHRRELDDLREGGRGLLQSAEFLTERVLMHELMLGEGGKTLRLKLKGAEADVEADPVVHSQRGAVVPILKL